ncbi:MAG: hypothetical protein JWM19_4209 [Actinomycetia bacterium]|nr:hypothetical protein [Actinomycetes bacterium]
MRPRTGIAAVLAVLSAAGVIAATTSAAGASASKPADRGQHRVLVPGDLLVSHRVLQNGLNLGTPYTVRGYPTGVNPGTGLPWAPATDGLRNITGTVNRNGTVTIWGVTSTVSGGGDQRADPNELVSVTDTVKASSLPSSESFRTVVNPAYDQVVRGVSVTPGTGAGYGH